MTGHKRVRNFLCNALSDDIDVIFYPVPIPDKGPRSQLPATSLFISFDQNQTAMSLESSPFIFLELIECLKNTQRSGWVRRGVPEPIESVSDHMYRMAIMCRMAPGV